MLPRDLAFRVQSSHLPRASGGVSISTTRLYDRRGSSPRKRGCFTFRTGRNHVLQILLASAGVFLQMVTVSSMKSNLPRASGGVSIAVSSTASQAPPYSPRLRWCFLHHQIQYAPRLFVPAPAGVFLRYSRSTDSVQYSIPVRMLTLIFLPSWPLHESFPRASWGVSHLVSQELTVSESPLS